MEALELGVALLCSDPIELIRSHEPGNPHVRDFLGCPDPLLAGHADEASVDRLAYEPSDGCAAFSSLGFEPEALIRRHENLQTFAEHVRSIHMVLAHPRDHARDLLPQARAWPLLARWMRSRV